MHAPPRSQHGPAAAAAVPRPRSLRYVNGYVCKSCKGKRGTTAAHFGEVVAGRGECWCEPGYGSYTKTVTNTKVGVGHARRSRAA